MDMALDGRLLAVAYEKKGSYFHAHGEIKWEKFRLAVMKNMRMKYVWGDEENFLYARSFWKFMKPNSTTKWLLMIPFLADNWSALIAPF